MVQLIYNWVKYLIRFNENIEKARSVLRKTGNDETHIEFNKIKTLLSANRGYVGHFTKWLLMDNIPYSELESLYKDHLRGKKLPQVIDKYLLPKDVIEHLSKIEVETAVNQMIQSIPSQTREFLKECSCEVCHGEGEFECEECDDDGKWECCECEGDNEHDCEYCNKGVVTYKDYPDYSKNKPYGVSIIYGIFKK